MELVRCASAYADDRVRSGRRDRCRASSSLYIVQTAPSRRRERAVDLDGCVGRGDRLRRSPHRAQGANIDLQRDHPCPPTTSSCASTARRRWLNVDDADGKRGARLFTASVDRLRATYTFTSALVRPRYRPVRRDHARPVVCTRTRWSDARGTLSAARCSSRTSSTGRRCSSLGYGDDRELDGSETITALQPAVLREGLLRAAAVARRCSVPSQKSGCIRAPMHPRSLRCSSPEYSRYSGSSSPRDRGASALSVRHLTSVTEH